MDEDEAEVMRLENEELAALVERIRAMLRWLLDDGHITPLGARQIEGILREEER